MQAWRGHFPNCPSKGGAMGAEVPCHHRCRSKQMFGLRRILCKFPQTFLKSFFVQLLPTNFLPQRPWRPYFGVTSWKRSSCVFMQTLGATFLSQTTSGVISTLISGLLPRFSANQNFWRCACNPCTSSSNTTAFHNSSIGDFIVYLNLLETNLLQLFRYPENWECFSIIYVIFFEVNIVHEQKQT